MSPNQTTHVQLWGRWCLAVALIFAVAGCSRLRHSAAVDPYRYAPPNAAETWKGSPEALPLAEGTHTNDPGSICESNAVLLHPLPGTELAGRLDKTNDLPDLIDLAQRSNPQTRVAWERARASAAQLGLADSAYLPVLAFVATAGYEHSDYPAPGGLLVASGPNFNPGATLQWTLIDFGRRRATFDAAQQNLLQANFQFNRVHQQVVYDVQRSFYGYDASRSRLRAAEATLKTAQTVLEASTLRLTNGLGTKSDFLQARQESARAQFELQSAQRGLSDAWALLAESLGVSPTMVFNVAELSELPMPTNLVESVEVTIDRALRQRPDLAAQLAILRSREADIRRAQSAYLPSIALSGNAGGTMGVWDATAPGSDAGSYGYADPQYSAFVTFSWTLFDGFARKNRLRESEARRDAARADLTALELKALREVWKAYADVKASFLQYDYARALIAASEDAYDAALTAYKNGLGTIVELLTAERDLARARTTLIESRAEVLTTSATLAYATGDWGGAKITHSPAAKKQ